MRLEHARQQTEDKRQEPADLRREVEFLERLHEKQDVWDQAVELALTFSGFLAFWLVGAAIFSALEVGVIPVVTLADTDALVLGMDVWNWALLYLRLLPFDRLWRYAVFLPLKAGSD